MRCCDMTVPINARPLMVLRLATSPIQEIGSTPEGTLTIFPVTGGSFEGERLRGKVLAGGGDWVTARSNGMMTLDLLVALETDDGSLIHMTSRASETTRTAISAPSLVSKRPRHGTRF